MTAAAATLEPLRLRDMARDAFDRLLVIVRAGVITGLLIGGIGSRLAMLLLRVTSDDSVHGVLSDDEFVIGRITLFGTISLLLLGTALASSAPPSTGCSGPG